MIFTMFSNNKKIIQTILAVTLWVAAWFTLAAITSNRLLIASPLDTLIALCSALIKRSTYISVFSSLLRIVSGLIIGSVSGILLGILAYRYQYAAIIIGPLVTVSKAVPVAAFAVIILIWWGPSALSFIISVIVVWPTMYHNTLEGLKATDRKMLEMTRIFHMPIKNRILYIYRPALKSSLLSGMKSSCGMSFKAGVAAEVIGLTNNSIGEQLYISKVYFDTAGVFAWAIIVILFSFLCEKIITVCMNMLMNATPRCSRKEMISDVHVTGSESKKVVFSNVTKSFGEKTVLNGYSNVFAGRYDNCLNGPSGSGKTTILRLIAGLEKPDLGEILCDGSVSMTFQEDRLAEDYSPIINVTMTGVGEDVAKEALLMVLDEESIYKACRELSGGMKRRVALVRAVEYHADILLLDEPYTGMDRDTIEKVREYIEKRCVAGTVITASHI